MKLIPITEKRRMQARLNGALSKGPKTPEGKARSSVNNLRHGFAAVVNLALKLEDKPALELHIEKTRQAYQPRDYAQESFVEQLAAINWRLSRLVGLETALLDAQISLQHDRVCELHPENAGDAYFHFAKAWQASATQSKESSPDPEAYDITSLELLRRYQCSLDRQLRNAILNLEKIGWTPPKPEEAENKATKCNP